MTREPRKPPGCIQSPTRTVHRPRTLGTSSAIQHHADKLCGEERGVNQGAGQRGGVRQGPGDHRPQRQPKRECAHRTFSLQRGRLGSDQYSRPLAPLPPAVSPPAPPRAAEAEEFPTTLQLLPATGGRRRQRFGLGSLQAAQRKEGEKIYSSTMGQATHALPPPRDPGLKDHHEARQGWVGWCEFPDTSDPEANQTSEPVPEQEVPAPRLSSSSPPQSAPCRDMPGGGSQMVRGEGRG